MKRAIAVLLLVFLLLNGCTAPARPSSSGPPLSAVRDAVADRGSRMPNGDLYLQRQKGTIGYAITALRTRGVRFSLEMNAAGLRHIFAIQIDAPGDRYPCTYSIMGGEKPFLLQGHIDANDYPRADSIVVDMSEDYPEARARELFAQYTPLLLSTIQEMLTECGAGASVRDFFPNFTSELTARL